jgi:hypothetical protein
MKPVAGSQFPSGAFGRPKPGPPLEGDILAPESPEPRTALVPLTPPDQGATGPGRCRPPAAPFLAHLIATAQQAPQTRARRRAEPQDATTIYAAAKKKWGTDPGFRRGDRLM